MKKNFSLYMPLIIVIFAMLSFITVADAATCTHGYSNSVAVPAGYGAAYNLFSTGKELVVQADCGPTIPILNVGSGVATQYIYKLGYAYKAGAWEPVDLKGTGALIASNWYASSASGPLPFTTTDLASWSYIVSYICNWTGTAWQCGCADTVCAASNWQLQSIQVPPLPVATGSCPLFDATTANTSTYPCSLFSAVSPWNMPATGSVDPNSYTYISDAGALGSLSYAYTASGGKKIGISGPTTYTWGPDYSIPLYYVDASTPKASVGDKYGWQAPIGSVPMPVGATPAVGSDHHMAVWDVPTKTIYEYWDLTRNSDGTWAAGGAMTWPADGAGYHTGVWQNGIRAYGGSATAGVIRYYEMKNGVINHALAMGYPYVRGFAYARGLGKDGVTMNIGSHDDNTSAADRNGTGNIPEGSRLRLKASVDLNVKCGTNSGCKIIGQALKTYGAYMIDYTGIPTLYSEVLTGKGVSWDGILGNDDAAAFLPDDFELLSLPSSLTANP